MSTNRWINPVNNNLLRDAEGNLLPGGTLEIYEAGTSTPLAVYSDTAQTISLGSTLTADAYGLIQDFHVTNGTQFKAIAKNSGGTTKWTRDYIFNGDSALETRLDSIEATVNALEGQTYNGLVNGGMRVATGSVLTLTTTFTVGKINRLFGRVTNVTAGTLTQGDDTAYASAKYGHFSGVSMSGSGVVEAQIRMPAGEAGRFADDACVFSCLVRHDVGSSVNYTVTVKTPTTTADDFSALTTISTSAATAVATGTDTRLEFAVADMGDCSKGIAIEVSASIGSGITTKNFRITEAQFEAGAARTAFTEGNFDWTKGALTILEVAATTASDTAAGIIEIATAAEVKAASSTTLAVTPGRVSSNVGVAKILSNCNGSNTGVGYPFATTTNYSIGPVAVTCQKVGDGEYKVTFGSSFDGVNYNVHLTNNDATLGLMWYIKEKNAAYVVVRFENSGGVLDDPTSFDITVFGNLA